MQTKPVHCLLASACPCAPSQPTCLAPLTPAPSDPSARLQQRLPELALPGGLLLPVPVPGVPRPHHQRQQTPRAAAAGQPSHVTAAAAGSPRFASNHRSSRAGWLGCRLVVPWRCPCTAAAAGGGAAGSGTGRTASTAAGPGAAAACRRQSSTRGRSQPSGRRCAGGSTCGSSRQRCRGSQPCSRATGGYARQQRAAPLPQPLPGPRLQRRRRFYPRPLCPLGGRAAGPRRPAGGRAPAQQPRWR